MKEYFCKKCEKRIDINDYNIFNGFCEKCYNKWINKKECGHINKKNENLSQNSISYIAILLGIISFSCSILILLMLYLISIPSAILFILDIISNSSSLQHVNEFENIFIIIKIIEIISFFSLIFNLFVIKIEKNSMTKIGLVLSSVTIVIWMFFIFNIELM